MPDPKPVVVEDIMQRKVVTLVEDDVLERVEEAMECFRIGHVPVLRGEQIVGLITHHDLARAALRPTKAGSHRQPVRFESGTRVRDIMTKELQTVGPQTPLSEAARRMRDHKLGCLPVTVHGGQLVGIVTSRDFLTLAIEFLEAS
jgi:CBS domain-containing protein